ncbi:MAG TPA: DNA repair ATPase [Thermoanaerobaculia bacterium]|nr:DNA repair ATPase [Thermoanaerobaculia bacterium]
MIEQGTYEVLRERLAGTGKVLAAKAERLNKRRIELFGGAEMALLGSDRIRTENNCVPRDIVEVGGLLLFGYNVFLGLKTETRIEDVFSLHRFDAEITPVPADSPENFLRDEVFLKDFRELYQYYKNSKLLQLRRVEAKLLAVFQTGDKPTDLRVFRWNVSVDGRVTYVDNRGERDHVFPPRHDFEWTQTTREDHVAGRFPHVSIHDEVFVETLGGDVTIKIEDNTQTGKGIYSEPVDDADQSLDDAQIHYAIVGSLILIKLLPYREKTWRYYVFNRRVKSVQRIDAIGYACIQLPEDHGIIFPGGYTLRTGETKLFEHDPAEMELMRITRAPNGEDVLYVFHRRDEGRTLLFPYNLIRKEVVNPLTVHGFSLFSDGKMIVFQAAGNEPTRVHAMQVWQTPFMSDDHVATRPKSDSHLEKIGNRELVRGLSSALSICRLIDDQTPTRATYEDLIAASARTLDAYHWLGHPEAEELQSSVKEIRANAELIIDEFEKVEALRAQAAKAVADVEGSLDAKSDEPKAIDEYVKQLAALRSKQGQIISMRELRYVDRAKVDALEAEVVKRFEELSRRTVTFLLEEKALAPFAEQMSAIESKIAAVAKTPEAEALNAECEGVIASLNLLTEILGSLTIEDPTVRIQILERISTLLGALNRVRALVAQRRRELLSKERVAEFSVQFALFTQTVTNAVSSADTPERCDAELSKLMLQLEELETRFSELDDFAAQLATKREEVYEAFSAKKQSLLEQRQRRAEQLSSAAERILQGIARRAETLLDVDALNAFFASDAMVAKLRSTSAKLRELGDIVRADEIDGRLKAARDEAARTLRDKKELFEEGANIVRFGQHRFSVNTQSIELTVVPRDGVPHLHITGTGFFEPITDPEFEKTKDFWEQELVSETKDVYRAEYLAFTGGDFRERYDEGYERGVHDHDAERIASALQTLRSAAGLLRYTPAARAAATLFWAFFDDEKLKGQWAAQSGALASISERRLSSRPDRRLQAGKDAGDPAGWEAGAPGSDAGVALRQELQEAIERWLPIDLGNISGAGEYLYEEIATSPIRFVLAAEASKASCPVDVRDLDLPRQWAVVHAYVPDIEAAAHILTNGLLSREVSSATTTRNVEGLLGQHPRVVNGALELQLDEFLTRLTAFQAQRVPGFRAYQQTRTAILERERKRLRLGELQPKIMSAFVRNKLISEVYLPLIGANLAKQIGVAGEKKRTDLMGLLLLVSPPGYGKTTLMEYIAQRLGLVFVKINGPALGHSVRSLDPAEAPNATSRQEIIKLNLALEMANNVLLYVDDIQHTHAEFLQKFISLCDAQRKIEGVWRGETKTYDLRGKRFAVCMAGNPYTESGEKFEIPDMLANRADVYNLGEVLQGRDELFELSYIENALTANPITAPLLTREPEDVHKLVRMARGEAIQADQLAHGYSSVELNELLGTMRHLVRVQQLLSRINRQYVLSAAQQNAYRTEPPFKLQGSYRNMSKLAEKVLPAMNDAELERLIDDHYLGEAQTLTTGAEENLLKLAEIRGRLNETQTARWDDIRRGFVRVQRLGGTEADPAARVMAELSVVSDRIGEVAKAIAGFESTPRLEETIAVTTSSAPPMDLTPYLAKLDETLLALRELHAARLPIAASPAPAPAQQEAGLISREAYLINGTLIPLLRFMAHRFKSYKAVADPRVKQAIARLEQIEDLGSLVSTLEGISVSALATLTDEKRG